MPLDGKSDFRSDTVTRPTPEMYEAMARAPLGDDVFGDDPTVRELEALAARLFDKPAALFVTSGTMGNQVAVRCHTERGDEVILDRQSHVFVFEQGGLAALSGLQARTLAGEAGRIDLDEIRRARRADNEHFPVTRLVVLENTHNMAGGAVLPLDYCRAVHQLTRSLGLRLHVDGARIANAEAATGVPLAEWAAAADSITCCLSKGLAAPVGTVLMGEVEFIRRARRARKLMGGGMRQAGILAACGIVALRDMRARLADDHRRARELAAGLAARPGLSVATPETNLVYVATPPGAARAIASRFEAEGVRCLPIDDSRLRFVVHKDIDDADVARALSVSIPHPGEVRP